MIGAPFASKKKQNNRPGRIIHTGKREGPQARERAIQLSSEIGYDTGSPNTGGACARLTRLGPAGHERARERRGEPTDDGLLRW